jgi:Fe/S biogenesis protein NfuA
MHDNPPDEASRPRGQREMNMTDSILNVTEAARQTIAGIRAEQPNEGAGLAIRLRVVEDGTLFRYYFQFVPDSHRLDDDVVIDAEVVSIYVDPESLPHLRGATLEFADDDGGKGFRFQNPNKTRLADHPLAERIQGILENHVNPGVAAHGGSVSLVDIQDSRVYVRLNGGCQGCGQAGDTIKHSVADTLKQFIPEITEVLDATDHASGSSPYC